MSERDKNEGSLGLYNPNDPDYHETYTDARIREGHEERGRTINPREDFREMAAAEVGRIRSPRHLLPFIEAVIERSSDSTAWPNPFIYDFLEEVMRLSEERITIPDELKNGLPDIKRRALATFVRAEIEELKGLIAIGGRPFQDHVERTYYLKGYIGELAALGEDTLILQSRLVMLELDTDGALKRPKSPNGWPELERALKEVGEKRKNSN